MQPRQRQQQHKTAAILIYKWSDLVFGSCGKKESYWVRDPFTKPALVISLIPHAGQSTAAGASCNEASGMAVG